MPVQKIHEERSRPSLHFEITVYLFPIFTFMSVFNFTWKIYSLSCNVLCLPIINVVYVVSYGSSMYVFVESMLTLFRNLVKAIPIWYRKYSLVSMRTIPDMQLLFDIRTLLDWFMSVKTSVLCTTSFMYTVSYCNEHSP